MSVKGRIVIEVMDDGHVRYVPDPALSRLVTSGAVLEVWCLVVGLIDLNWHRAIQQEAALAESAAAARVMDGTPP